MVERGTVTSGRADDEQQNLAPSVVAFGGGAVSFFTGSAIFIILGGTPPSSTPLASISGHMGWFGGVAFLGIGAVALVCGDSFRTGLAGYLAIGALGLGALQGLQWATWTYVDVLAAQHDQYDPLLETLISPYGAGHALTYGILVSSGVAFLGWELHHTQLTHRVVSWAGVALGIVGFLGMGIVLVIASAPRTIPFGIVILLLPLFYLWALSIAINIYRRQ